MRDLQESVLKAINGERDQPLRMRSVRSCAGGDINRAMVLDCGEIQIFVKYHSQPPQGMFQAEGEALKEIAETGTIRVPLPFAHGCADDIGFLAMEFLQLRAAGSGGAAALGRSLAELHRREYEFFGWHRNNTIGRTPQLNPPMDDWVSFFAEQRLLVQMKSLVAAGAPAELMSLGQALVDSLSGYFDGYRPYPSLLHGDLWGGNWSTLSDSTPVVYDPASYYGDRETDLAMTELFGGFGSEFYAAYNASLPLDPGYPRRRPLYQLYHILNHANLFGAGYVEQSRSLMRRMLEHSQ